MEENLTSIVIVKDKLSKQEFEKARQDYETYIKITIDLGREVVALGGEYHTDAEELLLSQGSRQDDVWGGGVNLETGRFETNAIINLRAGKNDSTEILEPTKREKFLELARRALASYVK